MTEPTDANTDDADVQEEPTLPPAAAPDYEGPRRRARREREERRAAQDRATAIEHARREAKRRVMGGPPDGSGPEGADVVGTCECCGGRARPSALFHADYGRAQLRGGRVGRGDAG